MKIFVYTIALLFVSGCKARETSSPQQTNTQVDPFGQFESRTCELRSSSDTVQKLLTASRVFDVIITELQCPNPTETATIKAELERLVAGLREMTEAYEQMDQNLSGGGTILDPELAAPLNRIASGAAVALTGLASGAGNSCKDQFFKTEHFVLAGLDAAAQISPMIAPYSGGSTRAVLIGLQMFNGFISQLAEFASGKPKAFDMNEVREQDNFITQVCAFLEYDSLYKKVDEDRSHYSSDDINRLKSLTEDQYMKKKRMLESWRLQVRRDIPDSIPFLDLVESFEALKVLYDPENASNPDTCKKFENAVVQALTESIELPGMEKRTSETGEPVGSMEQLESFLANQRNLCANQPQTWIGTAMGLVRWRNYHTLTHLDQMIEEASPDLMAEGTRTRRSMIALGHHWSYFDNLSKFKALGINAIDHGTVSSVHDKFEKSLFGKEFSDKDSPARDYVSQKMKDYEKSYKNFCKLKNSSSPRRKNHFDKALTPISAANQFCASIAKRLHINTTSFSELNRACHEGWESVTATFSRRHSRDPMIREKCQKIWGLGKAP